MLRRRITLTFFNNKLEVLLREINICNCYEAFTFDELYEKAKDNYNYK